MKDENHSPEPLTKQVINLVGKFVKVDGELDIDQDIYGVLGVDSVSSLDLLLTIETEFGIVINDVDFIKARTIRQLTNMVQGLNAA